ncbi:MAG: 4-hydroxy-3-methylbut-2-enyl diphosphate reductase [Rickettsiales bacterium]|jgi:4-hydroxy-3-methylbut-2-enyl diphosphate reductase
MRIILAKPRGFCAGVTRAIDTVENALKKFGAPIYVRHEIVHNEYVVEDLRKKGAIFVEEIADIPKGSLVIFSAHGVSDKVEIDAKAKGLKIIDATCPLVSKVHREAKKYEKGDFEIILIGHKGHPEVEGTSGRVKKPVLLVSDENDAKIVQASNPEKIAYVTQTTLSVDDTKKIVDILEERFPHMQRGLATKDICYATQNRQDAVKELSKQVDLLLVLGSQNSSNSNRLCDLGSESIPSYLIKGAVDINPNWIKGVNNIGITAGASAPEILVEEVIAKIKELSDEKVEVSGMDGIIENIQFALPKEVRF